MNSVVAVLVIILFAFLFVWVSSKCLKREKFAGNDGYYKITWDAPADTGGEGVTIASYSILIVEKEGGKVIVPETTLPATSLEYDFGKGDDKDQGKWQTTYTVSIAATNSEGVPGAVYTKDFTSRDPPADFTDAKYFDSRRIPLNLTSNPNDPITATFAANNTDIAEFANGDNSFFYLERDGNVIDRVKCTVTPDSGDAGTTFTASCNGFATTNVTAFENGDKVYFQVIYEEIKAGEPYVHVDIGKILIYGGPSIVQNVQIKWSGDL